AVEGARPSIACLAYHGGDIDPGSGEPGVEVASLLGASLYVLDGHVQDIPGRDIPYYNDIQEFSQALHVTSALFDDPRMNELVWPADVVVTFHRAQDTKADRVSPGSGPGIPFTFIGGRDEALREAIAESLRSAGFLCDTDVLNFPRIEGTHPLNPANRGRSGAGVQLEIGVSQLESFYRDNSRKRADRAFTTGVF